MLNIIYELNKMRNAVNVRFTVWQSAGGALKQAMRLRGVGVTAMG